jgi:hypothetical protein
MFENTILTRLFGPKEIKTGTRKMHNEEYRNLHASSSMVTEKDKMDRTWSTKGADL